MLTNRQLRILEYLLTRSFSGSELADVLKTSRRTIIRDIAVIDEWLKEYEFGQIDNLQKYSLVVENSTDLKIEIQKLKVQKFRILYRLLKCKNISIDEMTSEFFISKKDLEGIVRNINEEYKHLFLIDKQPRKGLLIEVSVYERINLIASLLFSFVDLDKDNPYQNKQSAYLHLENIRHTPLADDILEFETENQLLLQAQAYDVCLKNRLLEINFDDYLKQKLVKIKKIENFDLTKVLLRMNRNLNINVDIDACAQTIDQHLKRTIAFPSYFEGDISEPFEKMKVKYPFVFEFSEGIAEELQNFLQILYINGHYIALYMINALKKEMNSVDLVMYEERHSLSNINQKLIEDQIRNINLKTVHSSEELKAVFNDRSNQNTSILIIDSNQAAKINNQDIDYLFEGVLSNEDFDSIQNIVDSKKISREIKNSIDEDSFLNVTVGSDFISTLSEGLYKLKGKGLNVTQIQAIMDREKAGNQLIIGNLSVPHIQAHINEPFKLFYFKLDKRTSIQNNNIEAILIVVVNGSSTEYTQLFSYLYDHLKNFDLSMINSKDDLLHALM